MSQPASPATAAAECPDRPLSLAEWSQECPKLSTAVIRPVAETGTAFEALIGIGSIGAAVLLLSLIR
jgi:hypothetical protein